MLNNSSFLLLILLDLEVKDFFFRVICGISLNFDIAIKVTSFAHEERDRVC